MSEGTGGASDTHPRGMEGFWAWARCGWFRKSELAADAGGTGRRCALVHISAHKEAQLSRWLAQSQNIQLCWALQVLPEQSKTYPRRGWRQVIWVHSSFLLESILTQASCSDMISKAHFPYILVRGHERAPRAKRQKHSDAILSRQHVLCSSHAQRISCSLVPPACSCFRGQHIYFLPFERMPEHILTLTSKVQITNLQNTRGPVTWEAKVFWYPLICTATLKVWVVWNIRRLKANKVFFSCFSQLSRCPPTNQPTLLFSLCPSLWWFHGSNYQGLSLPSRCGKGHTCSDRILMAELLSQTCQLKFQRLDSSHLGHLTAVPKVL